MRLFFILFCTFVFGSVAVAKDVNPLVNATQIRSGGDAPPKADTAPDKGGNDTLVGGK